MIFSKFLQDEFENFEKNSLDVYVDSTSASGDYVIIPQKNKNFEAELKKYKIKISTKSKEVSSHEITNLKEFLNFIKNEFKVDVYDNNVYTKSGKLELFGNQQSEFLINVYNGPDYDDDEQLIDHNIKRKIASKKQNTYSVKQFISKFLK